MAVIGFAARARRNTWPPRHYAEVRAYLYNFDNKDGASCVTDGRLSPSIVNPGGVRLSSAQVDALIAATTGKHPAHPVGGCYIPHHAYVWHGTSGRIVGWVELCFGCLDYRASSPAAPENFDIERLRKLTVETGLPILRTVADYADYGAMKSTLGARNSGQPK